MALHWFSCDEQFLFARVVSILAWVTRLLAVHLIFEGINAWH
jgi:hypothetical protein